MVANTDSAPDATSNGSANGSAAAANLRTVRFKIRRQDAPDGLARWEEYDVPVEPGANVISCLQWIAANPTTREGVDSTPVVYDSGCLEEVCGSCTMIINGMVRQSCSCLVDTYAPNHGDTITLEPMSKFPVVRDLAVDRQRFFEDLKRVQAWVPIDGTYDLGKGPKEAPEHQQMRYKLSECMTCGCCLEACPQYTLEENPTDWESSFIGPAPISQARLFNEHETGSVKKGERLDTLMGTGGINDCGNAQNCVKVCPKEIPLTESIAAMGRAVTVHSFKRFFSGR